MVVLRTLLRLIAVSLAAGAILLGPTWREVAVAAALAVAFAMLLLLLARARAGRAGQFLAVTPKAAAARGPDLAGALRFCRSAFVGVALFSGVINMLMLAGAIYMLEVYDRVLPSRSVPTLVGLTILLLVLYGGQGLLEFVRGRVLVRIGAAVTEALGARLYSSVLKLPQKFGHCSNGLQPMRDLDNVRQFLAGAGPTALFDLPWLPVYLIVIFAFHVLLGVTALVGAIVLVTLTFAAERLTRNPVRTASEAMNARTALVDGS
jgi:ABC-type protease/lipase transport system fused ATPase/permease subunit